MKLNVLDECVNRSWKHISPVPERFIMQSGVSSLIKFDFWCNPSCLLVKEPTWYYVLLVFLVSYNGSSAKAGYLVSKVFSFGKNFIDPQHEFRSIHLKKTTHFAPSKSVLLEMWFFLVVKMGCKIAKKVLLVII